MEMIWFHYIWVIIIVYLITSYLKSKIQKHPPSPFPCLPIIGHFYLMFNPPFVHTFAKLAKKYGPILHFRLGEREHLLVSSPSIAEQCFTKNNDIIFCNRPSDNTIGRTVGYNYTTMKFAPYGPHWRNVRKITNQELLSSQRLDMLASIRANEVKLLIQRLYNKASAQQPTSSDDDYAVVDMKLQIFDATFNVMTMMVFGKRYYNVDNEEARRFRRMIDETVACMNMEIIGNYVPYLKWLDWWKEERCRKFVQMREEILKELINDSRRELDENVDNDNNNEAVKPMLKMLLELQQSDPEYYKDEIIIGIIVDLLEGGSDSSAGQIEWTLSLLLNHPDIMMKAQEEIDKHVGFDRFLDESDLNHLPYLQCIIKETLRMYPTNPVAPHESSEDCVVGGYHIRRGTVLMVNLWAIQNDPNIWDDPKSFRPERFEGVKGNKIGFKMMPFGSGRRSCPGEALGIRVVGLIIGSFMQCFDWKRVDDDKLVDMTLGNTFNLQRVEPLRARLKPRSVMNKLIAGL